MQTYTATTADRPVATDETDRLISSDKVVGTTVYNLQGEHLGSVYNLMVDKISGQVAYAVMSFGGLPGDGRELSSSSLEGPEVRRASGRIRRRSRPPTARRSPKLYCEQPAQLV